MPLDGHAVVLVASAESRADQKNKKTGRSPPSAPPEKEGANPCGAAKLRGPFSGPQFAQD
ncbi:MAG: hypothetical protein EBT51_11940 [Flavobacteriaceae bacterium]|nr:hypothetical protein [Flavobacteriaceae bacterium]